MGSRQTGCWRLKVGVSVAVFAHAIDSVQRLSSHQTVMSWRCYNSAVLSAASFLKHNIASWRVQFCQSIDAIYKYKFLWNPSAANQDVRATTWPTALCAWNRLWPPFMFVAGFSSPKQLSVGRCTQSIQTNSRVFDIVACVDWGLPTKTAFIGC